MYKRQELLYGHPPDLEDLRTIGCLCYETNVGEIDKFAARAKKCVLLGYTFGFKGCKLYDLNTRTVFHSRVVLFQENIFPFKDQVHFSANEMSDSSFLWPHSDLPSDLPAADYPVSSQS